VIPVSGCLELICQKPVELFAHVDDPVCHRADILLPIGKQLGLLEDERNQPCAMRGGVADFAALKDRELTLNTAGSLRVDRRHVQCPNTFSIQSSVLRKTLCVLLKHGRTPPRLTCLAHQ
jgi:hypothetical protein